MKNEHGTFVSLSGTNFSDFFDYIYTLKPVDYPRYLDNAGLAIDTVKKALPGAWLGAAFRDRNDTLWVSNVEWQSPAWEAGPRNRRAVHAVNGKKLNAKALTELLSGLASGDKIKMQFDTGKGRQRTGNRSPYKQGSKLCA